MPAKDQQDAKPPDRTPPSPCHCTGVLIGEKMDGFMATLSQPDTFDSSVLDWLRTKAYDDGH